MDNDYRKQDDQRQAEKEVCYSLCVHVFAGYFFLRAMTKRYTAAIVAAAVKPIVAMMDISMSVPSCCCGAGRAPAPLCY